MTVEVRVMHGNHGIKMARKDAEMYVANHPDAEIMELRGRGLTARQQERSVTMGMAEPVAEAMAEPEAEAEAEPVAEARSRQRRTAEDR